MGNVMLGVEVQGLVEAGTKVGKLLSSDNTIYWVVKQEVLLIFNNLQTMTANASIPRGFGNQPTISVYPECMCS